MSASSELLGAGLAASIAAIGTYFGLSQKLSGKIGTSEAGELWKESASIRDDYRHRIESSDRRILKLEERVATLEKTNTELAQHNATLLAINGDLERIVKDCRIRLAALEKENEELSKRIVILQATLKSDNA